MVVPYVEGISGKKKKTLKGLKKHGYSTAMKPYCTLRNILVHQKTKESTPLNKLAVADAAWARMPVDSLNMTLA